jgi:hypothetical protein
MIDRIELRDFRCFDRLDLDLHPRVTVLVGENGSGKSSIAEALASLAWGEDEGLRAFPVRWGAEQGSVRLFAGGRQVGTWRKRDGVPEEQERRRVPSRPWLLVYGRYRGVALPQGIARGMSPDVPADEILGAEWESYPMARGDVDRDRTTTMLRPDPGLVRAREARLLDLHEQARFSERLERTWRRLSESLVELGEGIEELRVDEIDGRDVLRIVRKGVPLAFDEIADGYRAVLSIVFDLVVRFVHDPGDDPLAAEATVVIDEVDLHLHPRWQRGVVRQLAGLFPNVRFLLTTHSPAVVQGAIDERFAVVRLSEGAEQGKPLGGEQLEDLRRAELGAVLLATGTFDVASRYSREVEGWEAEVVRLRKRVQQDEATKEERARLLELLDQLQVLFAQDERRRGQEVLLTELARTQLALVRRLERGS